MKSKLNQSNDLRDEIEKIILMNLPKFQGMIEKIKDPYQFFTIILSLAEFVYPKMRRVVYVEGSREVPSAFSDIERKSFLEGMLKGIEQEKTENKFKKKPRKNSVKNPQKQGKQ